MRPHLKKISCQGNRRLGLKAGTTMPSMLTLPQLHFSLFQGNSRASAKLSLLSSRVTPADKLGKHELVFDTVAVSLSQPFSRNKGWNLPS